jgi:hypothetical protein
MTTMRRRLTAWRRWLAGVGSVFAAWVAADILASSGLVSGAPDDPEFFVLWGVPIAVAAGFLAWYAVRGGREACTGLARYGCLGALLVGGAVFIVFLASPLLLPWDALRGAIAAFLYAPAAGAIGLLVGVLSGMRKRRPAGRRSAR